MTALVDGRFRRPLYRALNPLYARAPLSGEGAARYGGRFNALGTPALYTALDPLTAVREANQVGALQPTVLVSYRADVTPIVDGGDADALARFGSDPDALADPGWRSKMLSGRPAPTQRLAAALIAAGFAGLLVRSFAKGAGPSAFNLVLWRWSGTAARLEVDDDDDRLGRL